MVAALLLEDIDWRARRITIRGKRHLIEALPLAAVSGSACRVPHQSASPRLVPGGAHYRQRACPQNVGPHHRARCPEHVPAGKCGAVWAAPAMALRGTGGLEVGDSLTEVGQFAPSLPASQHEHQRAGAAPTRASLAGSSDTMRTLWQAAVDYLMMRGHWGTSRPARGRCS